MPARVSIAAPEHAARIAQIHMAAFGSNAMLLAQFPTEEVRQGLEHSIEMKARADIEDSKTTVIITWAPGEVGSRTEDDPKSSTPAESPGYAFRGKIVGFAKWAHPIEIGSDYEEPAWVWPEGTVYDVLNAWTRVEEEAQEAAIRSEPCYKLTFIATDPDYEKQGAGRRMVEWGTDRCDEERVPAFLVSTMNAVPFYEKMGFTSASELSLDISYRDSEGHSISQKYRELGMVYRPKEKQASDI